MMADERRVSLFGKEGPAHASAGIQCHNHCDRMVLDQSLRSTWSSTAKDMTGGLQNGRCSSKGMHYNRRARPCIRWLSVVLVDPVVLSSLSIPVCGWSVAAPLCHSKLGAAIPFLWVPSPLSAYILCSSLRWFSWPQDSGSLVDGALAEAPLLGLLRVPQLLIVVHVAVTGLHRPLSSRQEISWMTAAQAAIPTQFQPLAQPSLPSRAPKINPASQPTSLCFFWRMKRQEKKAKANNWRAPPAWKRWSQGKKLQDRHRLRRKLRKPRPPRRNGTGPFMTWNGGPSSRRRQRRKRQKSRSTLDLVNWFMTNSGRGQQLKVYVLIWFKFIVFPHYV